MFRLTVIALVLTLGASPLSPLVCGSRCDSIGSEAVRGEDIHHDVAYRAELLAGDECAGRVLDTWAFLREDIKRADSYAAGGAILVTSRDLLPVVTAAHYVVDHPVECAVTSPHLSLVLRV